MQSFEGFRAGKEEEIVGRPEVVEVVFDWGGEQKERHTIREIEVRR